MSRSAGLRDGRQVKGAPDEARILRESISASRGNAQHASSWYYVDSTAEAVLQGISRGFWRRWLWSEAAAEKGGEKRVAARWSR